VGSHLADALIKKGHRVKTLDCLDPQVHPGRKKPAYLNPKVQLQVGDVRSAGDVHRALSGVDAVFHLAAAVGVGQSMYRINHYVDCNSRGAAVLLEEIARSRKKPKRLVVASSMSIYGEGAYRCGRCGPVFPSLRGERSMRQGQWEPLCPDCRGKIKPVATKESKPLNPTSVYAVTKRDHEELFLAVGRAYRIPTVALRYFNIYGTRQALSNPYTGVAAIFCGRLLNNQPPLIFEDGRQTRDFVHVNDITQANLLALEHPSAPGEFAQQSVRQSKITSPFCLPESSFASIERATSAIALPTSPGSLPALDSGPAFHLKPAFRIWWVGSGSKPLKTVSNEPPRS